VEYILWKNTAKNSAAAGTFRTTVVSCCLREQVDGHPPAGGGILHLSLVKCYMGSTTTLFLVDPPRCWVVLLFE